MFEVKGAGNAISFGATIIAGLPVFMVTAGHFRY
jgi:hypothetical protein